MIGELDKTLTETFNKFKKALHEKRLNTFDDEKDYALLHYKKLVAAKIPNNLLTIIKRKLGAALMERELVIMKNVREKGVGGIPKNEKVLLPAIANLDEAMKLFGTIHYFYNYLWSRKLILESQLLPPQLELPHKESVDKHLSDIKKWNQEQKIKENDRLIRGLQLEPNMISTYALFSTYYRRNNKPDSSIYYQEKVVELLPNQAYAYFNLGFSYSSMKFINANNQSAPHPKAIEYLKKTIELDSTLREPYRLLGGLYMNESFLYNAELVDTSYREYHKAIPCYEKLVSFNDIPNQELLTHPSFKEIFTSNPNKARFEQLIYFYTLLNFLNKAVGNLPKAEEYLKKIHQKTALIGSASAYMSSALNMYHLVGVEEIYGLEEKDIYLKYVLDLQQLALSSAEENIKVASMVDKPLLTLEYREILKAIGTTHRALKNYAEAEKFYQNAIAYPVLDSPAKKRLKFIGGQSLVFANKQMTIPRGILKRSNGDYYYRIDAYKEMFDLKWEQGKVDEAFAWLEKAFQNSVEEYGNDISGKPFEEEVLRIYKNLDQDRFKALKAKYFPPK
jgi:hypothetical protein